LCELAETLRSEAMSKQAVAEAFLQVFIAHRERLEDDVMSDAIADCLDCLSGYCAPHARILPDEPDATLEAADTRTLV
jgi:hypothetical protein